MEFHIHKVHILSRSQCVCKMGMNEDYFTNRTRHTHKRHIAYTRASTRVSPLTEKGNRSNHPPDWKFMQTNRIVVGALTILRSVTNQIVTNRPTLANFLLWLVEGKKGLSIFYTHTLSLSLGARISPSRFRWLRVRGEECLKSRPKCLPFNDEVNVTRQIS